MTSTRARLAAVALAVVALLAGCTPAPDWQPAFPGDTRPGTLRWGASITGNGDPVARHETAAGHALGIRRTYFQWGARTTGMVDMARKDLAAGRLPWVSIKPPSWAEMASGARDGEIDQMLKALDKLDGPVWLTVHHEPEGGGGNGNKADDPAGPSAWRQMQSRVRARMDALGVDNVALASILMAWTFDSRSGRLGGGRLRTARSTSSRRVPTYIPAEAPAGTRVAVRYTDSGIATNSLPSVILLAGHPLHVGSGPCPCSTPTPASCSIVTRCSPSVSPAPTCASPARRTPRRSSSSRRGSGRARHPARTEVVDRDAEVRVGSPPVGFHRRRSPQVPTMVVVVVETGGSHADLLRETRSLTTGVNIVMAHLDELRAAVAENGSAVASAVQLIEAIADRLDQVSDDPAEVTAIAAELRGQAAALASAVAENTPAFEEPSEPDVPETPEPEVPGEPEETVEESTPGF